MTNEQTIEKLNDALTQLIEAYEVLLEKNDNLKKEIEVKNDNINDLENKLNELNGTTEVQSSKMDGMLNRIQSLLGSSDNTTSTSKEEEIDLRIEPELDFLDEDKNEDKSNENKIDLGRMESLLNGLNTK
jgi:uncharacterized coiled-coil protein SlyX